MLNAPLTRFARLPAFGIHITEELRVRDQLYTSLNLISPSPVVHGTVTAIGLHPTRESHCDAQYTIPNPPVMFEVSCWNASRPDEAAQKGQGVQLHFFDRNPVEACYISSASEESFARTLIAFNSVSEPQSLNIPSSLCSLCGSYNPRPCLTVSRAATPKITIICVFIALVPSSSPLRSWWRSEQRSVLLRVHIFEQHLASSHLRWWF
jgi:hypothetical protein